MKYLTRKLGMLAWALFFLTGAQGMAAEKKDVCVTAYIEKGSPMPYATTATVMSGSELNTVVGGGAKFQPYLTYAVIVWPDNRVNILTLSPRSMGVLPLFDTLVEDQYGKKWNIKSDHWFCYTQKDIESWNYQK